MAANKTKQIRNKQKYVDEYFKNNYVKVLRGAYMFLKVTGLPFDETEIVSELYLFLSMNPFIINSGEPRLEFYLSNKDFMNYLRYKYDHFSYYENEINLSTLRKNIESTLNHKISDDELISIVLVNTKLHKLDFSNMHRSTSYRMRHYYEEAKKISKKVNRNNNQERVKYSQDL